MATRTTPKPHKGLLALEGPIAKWYAKNRGSQPQLDQYRRQAAELTDGLADGATVLEVAPGPGFLAIEMARSGRLTVIGLDSSSTFVDLATKSAADAGVTVRFIHGDAADMNVETGSVDFIICQAAFKNFARPVRALDEMHRVLRPGSRALIQDMRGDTTNEEIAAEVREMGLNRANALATQAILHSLRRRAYTAAGFRELAAQSAFGSCECRASGIGVEVELTRAS
jgi:ubiquinone/menaquinone biosynthesis C-methylase UbiE